MVGAAGWSGRGRRGRRTRHRMHLVRSGREERVVERGRVGRVTGAPEDALVMASTRNTAGVCAARAMARPCSLLACFSVPAVGSYCVCGHFSLCNAHTLATRAPFILRFLARLSCLFFFSIPSLLWLILASNLQQGPIPLLRGTRPPRHHLFLSFAQRARCRPSHPQI